MRSTPPRLRSAYVVALFSLAVVALPVHLRAANELEQQLRDQYKGKTLLLRNFYTGESLHYDASGHLLKSASPGDWTVDGIVYVNDVKASGHHLTIRAERLTMGWEGYTAFYPLQGPQGKLGKEYEETRKLHIEADFSPSELAVDSAKTLLATIFLTSQDRFAELVPDYWRPCVLAGLTGKESKKYSRCNFSPEFLRVPGVAYPPEKKEADAAPATTPSPVGGNFYAGKGGVTRPKPISNPEPDFGPEARLAQYQGTVTLMLVVDKTGGVRDVRILSPLGCGLDRRAVESVLAWKFNPATKDDAPVPVELAVEVSFRLY